MSEAYLKVVDPKSNWDINVLYTLLAERTPEQAISHKKMPTKEEHVAFVRSLPYKVWYLLIVEGDYVGSAYLTKANELGIFIFSEKKGHGYADSAIKQIMKRFSPPFYANINPENEASLKFFIELGFELVQVTYAIGVPDAK